MKFAAYVALGALGWYLYLCPLLVPLLACTHWPWWGAVLAAFLFSASGMLEILGLILVALCAVLDYLLGRIAGGVSIIDVRPSQKYANRAVLAWNWRWMWLWGNEEDGIDGSANGFWAAQPSRSWAETWQIIRWAGWRNGVGNGRWCPFLGMTVRPLKVDIVGAARYPFGPTVMRQGWRVWLRFPWGKTGLYFTIGWRLDVCRFPWALSQHPLGSSVRAIPGCGFVLEVGKPL